MLACFILAYELVFHSQPDNSFEHLLQTVSYLHGTPFMLRS